MTNTDPDANTKDTMSRPKEPTLLELDQILDLLGEKVAANPIGEGPAYAYHDATKAIIHLITQIELAARINELELLLGMKGKLLVHGEIIDSNIFEAGNETVIRSNIVKARITALKKGLS